MYTDPDEQDFKNYFVRDFPYGIDSAKNILDQDIINALSDAKANLNTGLCGTQEVYTLFYLLLAAHFLVLSIQASSQGISGSFEWPASSKSVGSVSEGLSIPQRILDNPEFSYYTKTPYGAKYLMMVLPQLSGQIYAVYGGTQP